MDDDNEWSGPGHCPLRASRHVLSPRRVGGRRWPSGCCATCAVRDSAFIMPSPTASITACGGETSDSQVWRILTKRTQTANPTYSRSTRLAEPISTHPFHAAPSVEKAHGREAVFDGAVL